MLQLPQGLWFDSYGIHLCYDYNGMAGMILIGHAPTVATINAAIKKINQETFYIRNMVDQPPYGTIED